MEVARTSNETVATRSERKRHDGGADELHGCWLRLVDSRGPRLPPDILLITPLQRASNILKGRCTKTEHKSAVNGHGDEGDG